METWVTSMEHWNRTLLNTSATIKDAIRVIDSSSLLIAMIVDSNYGLLGIITDGDVRRAILDGVSLGVSVETIMNRSPLTVSEDDNDEKVQKLFQEFRYRHLPIVNKQNEVIGLQLYGDPLNAKKHDNIVVLMAGGIGKRLGELTLDCPKPLLKVGDKPILETIIGNFIKSGFYKFYISINYKAEMIEDYFRDGSRWGVEIQYLRENEKLGTAGALSLLPAKPAKPIIVMNGDLLTKVNFGNLLDFHQEHESSGTMCVREYDFQVPFGVVSLDSHLIESIDEKPVQRLFVNAGIYVLSSESIELIPENEYFDMPNLFERLIRREMTTVAFPIHEYWLDIGRVSDFNQANGDYNKIFK